MIDDVEIGLFAPQLSMYANIGIIYPTIDINNRNAISSWRGVHIIQIGAGGTGGYTAAELMRFIGNLPPPVKKCIRYSIVDGDDFEVKNLARQLCTEDDIGVNKATSLVNNYAPYFNIDPLSIEAVPKYINDIDDFYNIAARGFDRSCSVDSFSINGSPVYIFIDCLDKNTPRNILYDYIKTCKASGNDSTMYVVSSGNGKFAGQVSWGRIGTNFDGTVNYMHRTMGDMVRYVKENNIKLNSILPYGKIPEVSEASRLVSNGTASVTYGSYYRHICLPFISLSSVTNRRITGTLREYTQCENDINFIGTFCDVPLPYDRFPELLDMDEDIREEEMSCAERAVVNVQSIFANKTAATLVVNYVTAIIGMMYPVDTDKPRSIKSITAQFDCATSEYKTIPLKFSDLLELYK